MMGPVPDGLVERKGIMADNVRLTERGDIMDREGKTLAIVTTPEGGKRIVVAINNHAQLLEALRQIRGTLRGVQAGGYIRVCRDIAHAAIAKAEMDGLA